MQRNELLGQNRYQRLVLHSSVQINLVNHCQQWDDVIILHKLLDWVDDVVGLFGNCLLG